MRCPPQREHHLRAVRGVLLNVATCSAPAAILTAPLLQRTNALTGLADQRRHDSQWQYAISNGAPVATSSTAPQKHLPLYVLLDMRGGRPELRLRATIAAGRRAGHGRRRVEETTSLGRA
jgi:hypothetical protein